MNELTQRGSRSILAAILSLQRVDDHIRETVLATDRPHAL